MRMQTQAPLLTIAVMLAALTGCSHDSDPSEPMVPSSPSGGQVTINASDFDNWVYFSFEAGDTVQVTDPQTSTDWDLAFRRYHIATNSGDSGSGAGGAISMGTMEFEACTEAPDTSYVVDETRTFSSMQGDYDASVNPVLESWASREGMPPVWSYSGETFALCTASGHYAKARFTNYYNAEGTSGYTTFQYLYQPDGSRNLED